MRTLSAFAALLLMGPGLSIAQERPCGPSATGASVVAEERSSFGPPPPCPRASTPAPPVAPRPIASLPDPPGPAIPAAPFGRSLRAASYNPGRPAPANFTAGQRVIARTYDDFDRLLTETVDLEDGGQATIAHTYWRNGLRKTCTDARGRVSFYEYNGRNLLNRVTVNQGLPDEQTTSYEYWPDNLLKTIRRPNGTVTAYTYDDADRVLTIVVTKGTARLTAYEYAYDDNGNRSRQIEENGGLPETTLYGYDELNRLEVVTYPDGRSVAYGYDAVGNRIGETEREAAGTVTSDKTAVFDPINRLSTVTDSVNSAGNATFTYDRNGNLLTKTTASGTQEHLYDVRDVLVETREGEAITARFAWDAFGRRYLKIGAEGVRQYLYDQTSLLEELDEDDQEVAKYEYGQDHLASFFRRDEPRRYYHLDALGSITALSDTGGDMVARYHLDAWGNLRAEAELDQSRNRFAFTGYLLDTETDLYFAKARFYDPVYGRFTTQDSFLGEIGDPPSLHRYMYANARPTLFVDPTGHFSAKSVFKGAANVVLEPFRQAADVVVVGVARWTGIDSEDVQLNSALGKVQQARINAGQGALATSVRGIEDTVFAVATLGVGPAAVQHVQLAQAFERREITVDQYDEALSEMAGGQIAGAILAKAASRGRVIKPETQLRPRGAAAVRVIEGDGGPGAVPEGPVIEMVRNTDGTFVASFEAESAAAGTRVSSGSGPPKLSPATEAASLTAVTERLSLPVTSLDEAIANNYQRYYNEAGSAAIDRFNAGRITVPAGTNWRMIMGQRIDVEARARVLNLLEREGIAEGPGQSVLVNRWLRDPSGSGRHRIPDLRLLQSGRILDGTIGDKLATDPQLVDFWTFSGGFKIDLVRPAAAALRVRKK